MFPVLFQIGSFTIYAYGFMLAVAFMVGTWLYLARMEKEGMRDQSYFNLVIVIFVSSIVGARVSYVLLWEWQDVLLNPWLLLDLRRGGLAFHGGFLGALGSGLLYAGRRRLPLGKLADIIAPYVILGYAITRIGCFLNACCYGMETDVFWAFPASHGDNLLRHPTQLYGVAGGIIIFFLLKILEKKKKFPGFVMVSLVGLYSIQRFIIDFFRDDPRLYFLTGGQIVSLILFSLSLLFIYFWSRRVESGKLESRK